MAKRKKLQDQNPPRRVEIRGQDHLLAYITPKEAQLLMDNGGSGEPGPMGIPAFYDEGDDYSGPGGNDSTNDFGLSDDFGGGNNDNNDAAVASAQQALADSIAQYGGGTMDNPMADSAMTAADFAFTPNTYDLTSQAINNLGVARGGPRSLAGLTRAQYDAMPGYMQNIYDKTGAYNFEFGPKGRVTGFYGPPGGSPFPGLNMLGKGIVGLTDMLLGPPMTEEDLALRSFYTGFGEGSRPDSGGDRGDEPIKPADPETGQCPEGYIFDEDLQACRLDTGGVAAASAASQAFAPGAYARMSLLDQAPQGLLQVAGQPYDFDAANRAFRMATATRPEYYSDPYDLQGYTLLA